MQAVRGSSERVEWRWKLHLNLWPQHSRPRRALTKKPSRQHFPPLTSRARGRDFRSRIQGGHAAILAAAPENSLEGTRSFFRCRRAGAPGCVRFFARTSAERFGLEFTLRPDRYDEQRIPRLIFSHDLFEHRTKGDRWDRFRGKYLVPRRELDRVKIILLARDPRDSFVSLYLQLTRRDPNAPLKLRQKSVSEMLSDRKFGVRAIINAMNDWINEFSGCDNFTLVRYEALRASPSEHFRDLLAVLGESAPDATIFQEALDFSRFDNMQKLEAAGAFDSNILHPGDVRDPESFKVRRGKVGGYREYLSADDQQFAAAAMRELDRRFGYTA